MKKRTREQDIYYFDSGEQRETGACAGMLRQMIREIMRQEEKGSCSFVLERTARPETAWDRLSGTS